MRGRAGKWLRDLPDRERDCLRRRRSSQPAPIQMWLPRLISSENGTKNFNDALSHSQ